MAGGVGNIVGSLVGGMGGMGGMGGPGRMMGSGMSGMNGQNMSNPQAGQSGTYDVYDVDRWKRADGMDATATNVEMVRDAWDRKEAEKKAAKKEKSLLKRSKRKTTGIFAKKERKAEEEAVAAEMERPRTGTIHTSEMKKAEHNIESVEMDPSAAAVSDAAIPTSLQNDQYTFSKKYNYLGLETPSRIESFMTSNPLNSVILAVDSLSLGLLTQNQLKSREERMLSYYSGDSEKISEVMPQEENGTTYMNMVRENRENKKYEVHVRGV